MPAQPTKDKPIAPEPAPELAPDPVTAAPVAAEPPKPRFAWQATSADGKQAMQGPWRVRVQQLGGSGLWRPFVEWVGVDFATEADAERMLERLLK